LPPTDVPTNLAEWRKDCNLVQPHARLANLASTPHPPDSSNCAYLETTCIVAGPAEAGVYTRASHCCEPTYWG